MASPTYAGKASGVWMGGSFISPLLLVLLPAARAWVVAGRCHDSVSVERC